MTIRIVTPHALRAVASAAILMIGLSGCSDVKRAVGFEKAPPDEFQVVERAPLAMPPDFALRPPSPGSVRPQEGSTRDQARQSLLGTRNISPISAQGRTQGDMALLKRAGAENAQPEIRVLINKETQSLAEADKSFTDKLVFWTNSAPYGEAVDPIKESQRLRENQALGKAVTDGETPVIKRRRRGMLEGVLD